MTTAIVCVLILIHTLARALADTSRGHPRLNPGTWWDCWHLFGLVTSYLLPGYLLLTIEATMRRRLLLALVLGVVGLLIWAGVKARLKPEWQDSKWLAWLR